MIRCCCLLLSFAVGWTAMGAPAVAASEIPETLQACEDHVRDLPEDLTAFFCFTDLVRMVGHAPAPVQHRLEEFVETRPTDPRPRLALAALLLFRDGDRARQLVAEAMPLAERSGDVALVASVQLQRAAQYSVRLEIDLAASEYEAACRSAQLSQVAQLMAACEIERARFFAFNADEMARGWLLIRDLENQPWFQGVPARMRAHYLASASIIAGRLGLAREAYRLALQEFQLCEAENLVKQRATAQGMIVSHAAILPDIDREQAGRFARESIDYFQRHGMLSSELQVRFDWSRWADEEEAWRQLQIVDRESRLNPFCRPLARMALQGMGYRALAADPSRPEEALGHFREALNEALAEGGLQEVATSRSELALTQLRIDPDDLQPAWDALDAIEALADRQTGERWNMEVFSKRSPMYYALIDHLVRRSKALGRLGLLDGAHAVVRRMQARRLHDHLRRSGIAAQERVFDEDRPALDRRTAVLSFAIAPKGEIGSWLLVQTRQGTAAYPVDAEDLEVRVDFWRSLIEQRSPDEARAAARIYRDLLGDALAGLNEAIDRLVVIPDRILHDVPFAALRAAEDSPTLVRRYEIALSPSVDFWSERSGSHERVETGGRALLLADPFPDSEPGIPAAWRDMGQRASSLGALPFARREVLDAGGELGHSAEVRLGPNASEESIKGTDWKGLRLVHLAVHAVVDEEKPERSALILAASADQDGMLQPAEIASMPLTDAVVVLSACRSAGGRVLAGEGAMSLARAFFEAGSSTVVAGLWDLQDEETSKLMQGFYRHLARGSSVTESLAQAQREAIQAGAPTAAWSGLVVLGAGDVRPWAPSGRSRIPTAAWLVGIVSLLAIGAILWQRQRSLASRA